MSVDLSRYVRFLDFANDIAVMLPGGPAPLGPRMADFQRRDFAALAPTLEALSRGEMPPVRRYWLERTKGASKDTDSAVATMHPLAIGRRALRMQVVADDFKQASEIRLIHEQILAIDRPLNRVLRGFIRVQKNTIISDRNGSTIEILTRDDTGSHGARPDLVLANELSHITDEAFASTVLDNADKVPSSVVVVATNAGFSDSWQARWRSIAETSDRWYFSAVTEPAPWISAEDLAESKRRNPSIRYNRLWRGQWVRGVGDALMEDDLEAAVTMSGPMLSAEPGYYFGGGIDLSSKRDHSAVVVLAAHPGKRRVRLAYCQSWKPGPDGKVPLIAVKNAIQFLHYRFARCGFLTDPHEATLMIQELQLSGIPIIEKKLHSAEQNTMASLLLQAFKDRVIDLYRDEELLTDLSRLSIADRGLRGVKLEAPRDREHGHADRAIAMSIAMPGALQIAMSGLDGMEWEPDPQQIYGVAPPPQQYGNERDPAWGLPVGDFPGSHDSPRPNLWEEYYGKGNRP